jgi:hypothetical protein
MSNIGVRIRRFRVLHKGEASHDLSRFLCFGKEDALRGREFGDQIHTFSCLSVLHNAVVAWNTLHIGPIVGQLRAEGQVIDDDILGLTTPLFRKHLNPFGKYHFDLERMRLAMRHAETQKIGGGALRINSTSLTTSTNVHNSLSSFGAFPCA